MFSDQDPLEKYFKKSVQEMTPEDLVAYIKKYMSVVHSLELPVDPSIPRERSVFRGLKNTYGEDAGLIVKWVFWKYQGMYDSKPIAYFDFQKSRKWWTDLMYQELQLQLQKEQRKTSDGWKGFVSKL